MADIHGSALFTKCRPTYCKARWTRKGSRRATTRRFPFAAARPTPLARHPLTRQRQPRPSSSITASSCTSSTVWFARAAWLLLGEALERVNVEVIRIQRSSRHLPVSHGILAALAFVFLLPSSRGSNPRNFPSIRHHASASSPRFSPLPPRGWKILATTPSERGARPAVGGKTRAKT